jgi:hypothetical protein
MSKKYLYVNLVLEDQLAIPHSIDDARLFSSKEAAASALLQDLVDRLNDFEDIDFKHDMKDQTFKRSFKNLSKEISGNKTSAEVYELTKGDVKKLFPYEIYTIFEKTVE